MWFFGYFFVWDVIFREVFGISKIFFFFNIRLISVNFKKDLEKKFGFLILNGEYYFILF